MEHVSSSAGLREVIVGCSRKIQDTPHVLLSELLEVRGKSLTEPEIWSVLSQAVETIQDLFLKDIEGTHSSKLLITPSSLAFIGNGRIQFIATTCDVSVEDLFKPPEFDKNDGLDEESLERSLIYSLGKTLKYAASYPKDLTSSNDTILVSQLLNSTITLMCQETISLRTNVLDILELISQQMHNFTEKKPFTFFIAGLYREVLGLRIYKDNTKDIIDNQRTIRRSESDNRSDSDKYGRRLGYYPRDVKKISPRDRWKSAVAKITANNVIRDDLLVSENLTRDRMRLMEILQLDVNIANNSPSQRAERLRSKSLADVNCDQEVVNVRRRRSKLSELSSNIRKWSKGSLESLSIPSKNQSDCDKVVKSKMMLSRPTFRSTVYDVDNYPKLRRRSESSLTQKSKTVIGPEFVVMSSKPNLLLNIKQMEGTGNHIKHLKQVVIVLLNGRRLETNCDLTVTKAQHLWDAIMNHQKFNRKFLYGLAYIKDNEFIFLEPEQKLLKIIPPGLTEWRGNNHVDVTSFTLYVRVKYYINHNLIRDKPSRHLHYLQLRRDILEERTRCDPQKALFLGSLALQAEFGNYDESVFGKNYFFPDHYLSPSVIKYFGIENAKRQLTTLHGARKGVSEDLAESEFIEAVEKLSEYGYHFHLVQQGKKAKSSKTVILGISSKGIGIFDTTTSRERNKMFEWKWIQRITYDEKHIYLTIIPEKSNQKKEKLKFHTEKLKCRYIFHMATSHHRLHLMLDCNIQIPDLSFQDTVEHNYEYGTNSDEESSYELKRNDEQDYAPELECGLQEETKESAFVLGTSFGYPGDLSQMCREDINDSLASRFDKLGNTSVNERRLVATTLRRSPIHGFGLSVTTGDDQGIYIRSVLPQSPADLSAVLLPGDRIFSVNQILVDCMQYVEVLDLIRKCKDKMDIVVSQQISVHELSTIKEELEISALNTPDKEIESVLMSTPNAGKNFSSNQITSDMNAINSDVLQSDKFSAKLASKSDDFNSATDTQPDSHDQNEKKEIVCFDSAKCNGECEIIKYENFIKQLQNNKVVTASSSDSNCDSNDKFTWELSSNDTPGVSLDSTEKISFSSLEEIEKLRSDIEQELDQIKSGDIFHIVLEKPDGSFGINIKGGVNSSGTEKNILVQEVIAGGAADLDGRIKVGDVILEVNGSNLTGATHQEAVEALRTTSPLAHLTLRRGTPSTVVRVRSSSIPNTSTQIGSVRTQLGPPTGGLMGSSSAIFTRPDTANSCSIKHSLSSRSLTQRPVINQGGNSWRYTQPASSNFQQRSMPPANSNASFKTTIQLNTSTSQTSVGSSDRMDSSAPVNMRRNSDDGWGTRISFGNDTPNVIRLRVNFGEEPSLPGVLKRSLTTDLTSDNLRRRSSLEWIPSTDSTVKVMSTQGVGNRVFTHKPSCNYSPGVCNQQHMDEMSADAKNRKKLSTHEEESGIKHPNVGRSSFEYKSRAATEPLPSISDMSTDCVNIPGNNPVESRESIKTKVSFKQNENSKESSVKKSKEWVSKNDLAEDEEEEVPIQVEYPFVTEENTFEVSLLKNSRGLGLSVCGGWDADPKDSIARLIRVKRLYPLQPAAECGKLAIGDIVLAINHQSLIGLMYFEAIEVLRMASNPIILTVCRPAPGVIPPIPQSSSLLATACTDESDSVPRYNGPTFTEFDVTLTKIGGSLGFTLVKLDGPNAGHYIKALVKDPALSDGQLQPGDKIILVNGTDISDMSHSESIKFLRELPDEVTLCVWRQVVPPSSPTSPTSPTAPSFPDEVEKKFKPKPLLRKEALDMLNDKSRPKGCRKNLNGGSPLASPRIRRKQVKDGDCADAAVSKKDEIVTTRDETEKNLRVGSNVSSSRSTSESSTSGIDKGTSSSDRSYSSPVLIPGQSGTSILASSPESPGKPQRPSYLDLTAENMSPRKQKFGRAPHHRDFKADDLLGDEEESEESSYIRYFDSGDSLLATDDGLTTVTSSEGSPVQMAGQSALLKWRGAKLASQEDVGDISEEIEEDNGINSTEKRSSIITVDLNRAGNSRLGLSLMSMDANDTTGVYVKVVYPGSLAEVDGRIQVGDKLLQINDTTISGMSVDEAIELLRNQNGKMSLVLERESAKLKNDDKNHSSSLGRSWSEQEKLLSNEVSLLNAKNNNLSSADCLHWKAMASDQDENENYSSDS